LANRARHPRPPDSRNRTGYETAIGEGCRTPVARRQAVRPLAGCGCWQPGKPGGV